MRKTVIGAVALLWLPLSALGRGVSPYLPLSIDPELENQIERLLMLADKPVLTRPITAATVLDALPDACPRNPELCNEVRQYLHRYMRTVGMTNAQLEVAATGGAETAIPNRHGLSSDSAWEATARAYYQMSDHVLFSLGAVAHDGKTVPTGSMLSVGYSRAQLDIGYRDHWWSPMSDSSMLLSTEATTMPSVTISSYVPLTRFGFHYEAFVASMSRSDRIQFGGEDTSGRPRLAGFHLSMEPATGWSLGVNRLMQYGGGERPGAFSDLIHAFLSPSRYDNTNANLTSDQQFGNQLASITSEFIFPGRVPFAVYYEYGGEDTSHGRNYLLGNSSLSAGIRFPQLVPRIDLTYEVSEWQNGWYANSVYRDGLTNDRRVIGHWGGDQRASGDAVGAMSQMLGIHWRPRFGGTFEARYRTLRNESYSVTQYERAHDATLRYSHPLGPIDLGAEVVAGRDVFGESYSRTAAFVRLSQFSRTTGPYGSDLPRTHDSTAELFVDFGANFNEVRIDLSDSIPVRNSKFETAPHLAVGARRAVSDHSDLGARVELDDVNGHTLLGVRAIDYRYRFANPLAITTFVGAARYDLATPAYGIYLGMGLQWRNVRPGWDIGIDTRYATKVARDNLVAGDEPTVGDRSDSFYDIYSATLSLTRRF